MAQIYPNSKNVCSHIGGTNLYYYLIDTYGVKNNPKDMFDGKIQSNNTSNMSTGYVLYVRPDDILADTPENIRSVMFAKHYISKGKVSPLTNKKNVNYVFDMGCNFIPDRNGNLLLKTLGCDINTSRYGNMLISGSGEVLHAPQQSTHIYPADRNGYYPIRFYPTANTYKVKKNSELFNFLTPSGDLLLKDYIELPATSDDNYFVKADNSFKINVKRNKDKIKHQIDISKSIVYATPDGVELFPSEEEFLMSVREKRSSENEIKLSFAEELKLVESIANRNILINDEVRTLGILFDNNQISAKDYAKAMSLLDIQLDNFDEFLKNATNDDRRIIEHVFSERGYHHSM